MLPPASSDQGALIPNRCITELPRDAQAASWDEAQEGASLDGPLGTHALSRSARERSGGGSGGGGGGGGGDGNSGGGMAPATAAQKRWPFWACCVTRPLTNDDDSDDL
jgi:hypothetical protein